MKKNNFTFCPGKSQENSINIFQDFPGLTNEIQGLSRTFQDSKKNPGLSRTFPGCGNPGKYVTPQFLLRSTVRWYGTLFLEWYEYGTLVRYAPKIELKYGTLLRYGLRCEVRSTQILNVPYHTAILAQNSSAAHLAVCSLSNLRTHTLLIRYLILCPSGSGRLETGIQGSERDGPQNKNVDQTAAT